LEGLVRALQDFLPLLPAEQTLLDAALEGAPCILARSRPASPGEASKIRAAFLRFLALGGENRTAVPECGLKIQGAFVEGAVNLDGATAVRPLWIQDCTLTSEFSFSDAETKVVSLDGTSVSRIRGDGVQIDGSLLLRRTIIEGSLQLFGAEITGTLSCTGCVIDGRPWRSQRLAADLATVTVGGHVELRNGFQANGLILLDDCEIGGTFDCSNATLSAGCDDPGSAGQSRWDRAIRAMKCHRLHLRGSLYLRDCKCEGEVSFSGAVIGGDIDCRNGHFRRSGDDDSTALRFTRIEAAGNIYLASGFKSEGKVQLNGAIVRGNIDCRGGTFVAPGTPATDFASPGELFAEDALSFVNARVNGALIAGALERKEEPAAAFHGSVDLKGAHIRVIVDSPEAWPRSTRNGELRNVMHLDGLTYDRFAGVSPIDARTRKTWLRCQPAAHLDQDFKPQPIEQLISVLKTMGHPEEAKNLAIERQWLLTRRRAGQWSHGPRGALRALGALIWAATGGLLIGHGYRPMRVLFIMAAVGIACGYYYKLAAEKGMFAPRDSQVFLHEQLKDCRPENGGNWTKCTAKAGDKFAEYPQFNPWVYSFNVLLPVVDLQQEKSWVPMQRPMQIDLGQGRVLPIPDWGTSALVLTELIFGWIASLLAIAAFSGLVKTE
jgi:hypothetical protein